jgi:DNA-binding NarL/FixJ family response regulator
MRILIVDDHDLFRESLVNVLNAQVGMMVVDDVGTAQEAVERATELKPDLILLDIELPDFDGLEAMKRILCQEPETKIVILTIHDTDDLLFSAFSAGAKGFLLKNTPIANFIASLRAVERGEVALSREKTARLLNKLTQVMKKPETDPIQLGGLTIREQDIVRLLAQEKTNTEIADELVISKNTVKVHIYNILKKLNLQNRQELSRFARQISKY